MRPLKIAYIIWTVIALLGVVCLLVPEDGWHIGPWDLRFPTLAEALDLNPTTSSLPIDSTWLAEADTVTVSTDTVAKKDSISPTPQPVIPEVNVVPTDSRAYLAAFYAALDSTASMPVRVVHYGDSQIEEDRITNILRENWQKQYGGGGVGLIPLHQTIPTRSIRQTLSINGVIQTSQKGPQRYIVYGPKSMRLTDSDDYGVMGQVAILDSTLVPGSDSVVLHVEPLDKKRKTYHYFSHVRVLADSSLTASLSPLLDSTTHCDITIQGRGKVYGVSLETDKGVVVDNIPMRGCSGNIFTKIDSTQLSNFYRETNTRLIILQFGGNMIPQTENPATIRGYVRSTMRQQVRYIRSCAPQASILFIGPSDMSTNIVRSLLTAHPRTRTRVSTFRSFPTTNESAIQGGYI